MTIRVRRERRVWIHSIATERRRIDVFDVSRQLEYPIYMSGEPPRLQPDGLLPVLKAALSSSAAWLALASALAGAEEAVRPELELASPDPGQRVRLSVPLVEVSGRAGGAELFASDVVIAIDLSNSALLAADLDVDGDGVVGRTKRFAKESGRFGRPYRSWTTDPGDTVLSAEIIGARAAIERLTARRNRIGVLTFTAQPRVRAWVGPPEAAREAVDGIRVVADWTGTDIARALSEATRMLEAAPPTRGPRRSRAILLFSDGKPTAPDGEHWASRRALKAARELAEQHVKLWTFALGSDKDADFLEELARATGGDRIPLETPSALFSDPAPTDLEPRELSIENLTTGEGARAVRTFPDGTFDGFVPLAPGENTLEVRALLADGQRVNARREVHYERPEPETEIDRRNAARLLVELRRRTREIGRSMPDEAPSDERRPSDAQSATQSSP